MIVPLAAVVLLNAASSIPPCRSTTQPQLLVEHSYTWTSDSTAEFALDMRITNPSLDTLAFFYFDYMVVKEPGHLTFGYNPPTLLRAEDGIVVVMDFANYSMEATRGGLSIEPIPPGQSLTISRTRTLVSPLAKKVPMHIVLYYARYVNRNEWQAPFAKTQEQALLRYATALELRQSIRISHSRSSPR